MAPPKRTSLSYEANGRVLSRVTEWTPGFPTQPGVSSTQDTYTYTLTGTSSGEQACDGSQSVLQTVKTDGQNNQMTNRVCTLNSFPLSSIDALGRVVTFERDVTGLLTKITHPNDTSITYDYYYQCPTAQDGMTATCPNTSTAQQDCPYDDASPKRTCIVHTLHEGSEESYVDGVVQATMKDGMGRNLEVRDNLGGEAGTGYSSLETRQTSVYDSLGLITSRTAQIGASSPLIYQSTTSYGPKLRPVTACLPRGIAHQFVHDDIGQRKKKIHNGHQYQQIMFNDSHKLTAVLDCPVVASAGTMSVGDCPTVASDTSTPTCSGDTYQSYILRDGGGLEHSTTAVDPDDEPGASVRSVTGVPRYSADRLKYNYEYSSLTTDRGEVVTGSTIWERDLQGFGLSRTLTLVAEGGPSQFASDTMSYDNIGEATSEANRLEDSSGSPLEDLYAYTPTEKLSQRTSYAGVTFDYYYDSMDRMIRFCYPDSAGGSEGETIARDPITGKATKISHFTNPAPCSECSGNDCGDVVTESISLSYTRFDAVQAKTYSDGTRLEWAYDPYQRISCFADAMATASGYGCPASPTDPGWIPAPSELLEVYIYWADDDTYRRGLPQSTCRGVFDGAAGEYATKCMDTDYYTSVDEGGSCDSSLSDVTGAYASSVKTKSYCDGGSCLDGEGSLVYQTTYRYDEHRRPCSVESREAGGALILGTTYSYDQYNNVVSEQHASDLDPSTASNYQIDYTYDGLMRLAQYVRSDSTGNLLESISYEYDAASNITKKVQSVALQNTPTPTPAPIEEPMPTIGPEPLPPATATTTPTTSGSFSSSGCAIARPR